MGSSDMYFIVEAVVMKKVPTFFAKVPFRLGYLYRGEIGDYYSEKSLTHFVKTEEVCEQLLPDDIDLIEEYLECCYLHMLELVEKPAKVL